MRQRGVWCCIVCNRPTGAQAAERDTPRALALHERARAMSAKKSPPKFRNRLLAAMSTDDRALLQPSLEAVPLPRTKTLEPANKKIENVYFPEIGLLSVVGRAKTPNREPEL